MIRCFALSVVILFLAGCHPSEGERCNPNFFQDECQAGLTCVYPTNCAVAFCCPNGVSLNPNCQTCIALDGGTTD